MLRFNKAGGGNQTTRWMEKKTADWFRENACVLPGLVLDEDEESELFLLACGAYNPLPGFMNREDYYSVLNHCRLSSGRLWPLPVVLSLHEEQVKKLPSTGPIALFSKKGQALGVLLLRSIFRRELQDEARKVFGTADRKHPGVAVLMTKGPYLAGGEVMVLKSRENGGFSYPWEPEETKRLITEQGWKTVAGFQTRNPIHRAHEYLQKIALELVDGLLIHPLVGRTKAGDIPAGIRMRCYEELINHYYPKNRVLLGVFPAVMRYAGPREALFHVLVRKNYGCTHMIIGRDHAGVGGYYTTYEAQEFCVQFVSELEVEILCFENAFYCNLCKQTATEKTCPHPTEDRLILSGTKVREILQEGGELPPEFTRPEVASILKEYYAEKKAEVS